MRLCPVTDMPSLTQTAHAIKDRYAVIGHPVSHSLSPQIHSAFADQTQQCLSYEAILAPLDGFHTAVMKFIAAGGKGMNVTVPFKTEAFALADTLSLRAESAGAVNTLVFKEDGIFGDNTDGVGLVQDLTIHQQQPVAAQRILLLGAGGAAQGVILPLLQQKPAQLILTNRTFNKAQALVQQFIGYDTQNCLQAVPWSELASYRFDVVINATSASLKAQSLDLSPAIYTPDALAYDMVYHRHLTTFLHSAQAAGIKRLADGLGMLVEQAAESFMIWRSIRPQTAHILAELNHLRGR